MAKRKIKISTLENKLTELAREYVIKRDKSMCQYHNKKIYGRNVDISHVVPKSRSYLLRWNPDNLQVLCHNSHLYWWHKEPLQAGKWFEKNWPKRAKYLNDHRHINFKDYLKEHNLTKREWLEEWRAWYEDRLKNA